MKPASLLAELRKRGVEFSLKGDNIVYRAPKGAISDELLSTFKSKKQSIVDELRAESSSTGTGLDHLLQTLERDTSEFVHENPYGRLVDPIKARLLSRVGLDKCFVRGDGCYLWDDAGNKFLDCIAQYGGLPFGYNPDSIWNALDRVRQLQLPNVATQSLLDSAGRLAERLLQMAPKGMEHVVFCNSGTEATEVAIKLCRAATGRPGILSTRNGFHGLTTGSLSVTGSESFQNGFFVRCEDFQHVPFGDAGKLAATLESSTIRFAAFFVEPIQGEAGIIVPPPSYLKQVREICNRFDVLFVIDEVQTGLGRTGRMFGCDHAGVVPDVMTLAKALGGGLMPVGAVLCQPKAYSIQFGLRHSSTFAGNALAAECGLATLEKLAANNSQLVSQVAQNGEYLKQRLEELQTRFPSLIRSVRGLGFMLAIEFSFDSLRERKGLLPVLVDQQLLLHLMISYMLHAHQVRVAATFMGREILRIEPPLIAGPSECDQFVNALESTIQVVQAGDTASLVACLIDMDLVSTLNARRRESTGEFLSTESDALHDRQLEPNHSDAGPTSDRAESVTGQFGFIVHLSGLSDLIKFDPSLAVFSQQQLADLKEELTRTAEPVKIGSNVFRSNAGAGIRGHFILVPYTPAELLEMPKQDAIEQFQLAAEVAMNLGVGLIGLGGFTSIVTHGGLALDADNLPPLTSGNAYTVATTLDAIEEACAQRGVKLGESTVAVVGAAGQIGRAVSILLSESAGQMMLVGRDGTDSRTQNGLRKTASAVVERELSLGSCMDGNGSLAQAIRKHAAAVEGVGNDRVERIVDGLLEYDSIVIAKSVAQISKADIVIAVSSAVEPFILSEHIKRGAIVCDSSRPANILPEVIESRPDVTWIAGGLVRIPGSDKLDVFAGPLPNAAYACVAESVLWTLEPSLGNPSATKLLDVETISALRAAGEKHGFELSSG